MLYLRLRAPSTQAGLLNSLFVYKSLLQTTLTAFLQPSLDNVICMWCFFLVDLEMSLAALIQFSL